MCVRANLTRILQYDPVGHEAFGKSSERILVARPPHTRHQALGTAHNDRLRACKREVGQLLRHTCGQTVPQKSQHSRPGFPRLVAGNDVNGLDEQTSTPVAHNRSNALKGNCAVNMLGSKRGKLLLTPTLLTPC